MKSNLQKSFIIRCLTATLAVLVMSCSHDKTFSYEAFNSPSEGVKVCRKFLAHINNLPDDDDAETVSRCALEWMALRDSVFSCFYRDSTAVSDDEINKDFYIVSDTIRKRLMSMADNGKRSLKDAVYIKIHTMPDRNKIRHSECFSVVQKFYETLSQSSYNEYKTAIEKYDELFDFYERKGFQDEEDVRNFIRREDKCFRSIMPYLSKIPQETMISLTEKTENALQSLYATIEDINDEKVQERVIMTLTMRLNRRQLQNAFWCRQDINQHKQLSQQTAANYKWMLLQPFLFIDDYAIEILTTEQEGELLQIAEELPGLFKQIYKYDNEKQDGSSDEMMKILQEYILVSHLKTIL